MNEACHLIHLHAAPPRQPMTTSSLPHPLRALAPPAAPHPKHTARGAPSPRRVPGRCPGGGQARAGRPHAHQDVRPDRGPPPGARRPCGAARRSRGARRCCHGGLADRGGGCVCIDVAGCVVLVGRDRGALVYVLHGKNVALLPARRWMPRPSKSPPTPQPHQPRPKNHIKALHSPLWSVIIVKKNRRRHQTQTWTKGEKG